MSPDARACVAAIRAAFAAHADAARAPAMQAYMKSALPFHGIAAPLRRQLQAEAVAAHPLPDTAALAAAMRHLWREAGHREERYAAMELARIGAHRRLDGLMLLPVYEEMIRDGAWWDYCDDISGNALATLLQRHPAEMKPLLRRWARGGDLWLRRAAMLLSNVRHTVRLAGQDAFDQLLGHVHCGLFLLTYLISRRRLFFHS